MSFCEALSRRLADQPRAHACYHVHPSKACASGVAIVSHSSTLSGLISQWVLSNELAALRRRPHQVVVEIAAEGGQGYGCLRQQPGLLTFGDTWGTCEAGVGGLLDVAREVVKEC